MFRIRRNRYLVIKVIFWLATMKLVCYIWPSYQPVVNETECNSRESTKTEQFRKDRNTFEDAKSFDNNVPNHPNGHRRHGRTPPPFGEMGAGVGMDVKYLSPEDRMRLEDGWQKNAFNQFASDLISVERTLPDYRLPKCRNISYKTILPQASVIIPFYNEAWSTLIRTVHSVLNRSPSNLLKEIILADDASTFDHLMTPLEHYLAGLPQVKLVRLPERGGLVKARLAGYAASSGEVVMFMDSHCEVTEGWLEPLLDRLADDDTVVVTPVIDVINAADFSYRPEQMNGFLSIGGFQWTLTFLWNILGFSGHDVKPIKNPTLIGCFIGVSRRFFDKIGTFDGDHSVWGGENLEISFKAWMCGGSLEIIPCSRVGHVYKNRLPYISNEEIDGVVQRNLHRLAEVWMDDYKLYFHSLLNYRKKDYGNVSSRQELRKSLKCQSFDWYLQNVYPNIFIPGFCSVSGEVSNKAGESCIDCFDDPKHYPSFPLQVADCHGRGENQVWYLCEHGQIRRHGGCWTYMGQKHVSLGQCVRGGTLDQSWLYREDNTIYHTKHAKCLELNENGQDVEMKDCNNSSDRQIWIWNRAPPAGPIPTWRNTSYA